MSFVMVEQWVKQFTEGRTNIHNLWRWLLDSMVLFDYVQQLHDLLEEDRRMINLELCFHFQATDCGMNLVHKIVNDVLSFWKLSSRWLLPLLTDEHMENQMGVALSFLFMVNQEDNHGRWDLHPLLHTNEQIWCFWSVLPRNSMDRASFCIVNDV